jgi:HNH endonuclease
MTDLQFLVVLPEDNFRCAFSTDNAREASRIAFHAGGKVAILSGSVPFSALVSFLELHRELAAVALQRAEWRARRIEGDPHCDFCRRPLTFKKSTVDHATPVSRGGMDTPENWLLACRRCNESKGDDTVEEYRERFLSGVLFDRSDAPKNARAGSRMATA